MIYKFLRFFFFLFDPEMIHDVTLFLLSLSPVQWVLSWMYRWEDSGLEKECFGIRFKNPVGLAAGFDKNGKALLGLQALGFGFLEIGTVTSKPQPGNKKPRIFRFKKEEALLNVLGFNNEGVDTVVKRIKKVKPKLTIPVGLNIGKGRETSLGEAIYDYLYCLEVAYPVVDFFVINVSSPNTPGLKALQGEAYFSDLLGGLQRKSLELAKKARIPTRPLLVKLSPDLSDEELLSVVPLCQKEGISGIIATNTTTDYSLLPACRLFQGGVSGKPLFEKSTQFLTRLKRQGARDLTLVGVGGIFSSADAKAKFDAGADLIEIYTGFIFEGPGLIKKIKKPLLLERGTF